MVGCGLKNMPNFGLGYGSVFKEIAIQVGGLEFRSPEPQKCQMGIVTHQYSQNMEGGHRGSLEPD